MAQFPPGISTFGIEIELLGVFVQDPESGTKVLLSKPAPSHPHETQPVRLALSGFFQTARLPIPQAVNLVRPRCPRERYDAWTVKDDDTIKEHEKHTRAFQESGSFDEFGTPTNVSCWLREAYGTVPEELRKRICFGAMEIVSPVLPANKQGLKVVELLYNEFLNQHAYITNNTCGFHFHIGKQKFAVPDGQFSLRTLKNLAQVALAAEYQLCCLQPEHRAFNLFARTHTLGLAPQFRDPSAAFDLIEGVRDVKELAGLTNALKYGCGLRSGRFRADQRCVAVNMLAQDRPVGSGGLAPPVEFRAGEASLVTERTLAWLEFVLEMVYAASKAQEPWAWLRDYGPHVSPEQLLRDLRLFGLVGKLRVFKHNHEEYLTRRDGGLFGGRGLDIIQERRDHPDSLRMSDQAERPHQCATSAHKCSHSTPSVSTLIQSLPTPSSSAICPTNLRPSLSPPLIHSSGENKSNMPTFLRTGSANLISSAIVLRSTSSDDAS